MFQVNQNAGETIYGTRLANERRQLADHLARLKEAGPSDEEIKRVIDPISDVLSSVTVKAGTKSATFTVSTKKVTATSVTISGTYGAVKKPRRYRWSLRGIVSSVADSQGSDIGPIY